MEGMAGKRPQTEMKGIQTFPQTCPSKVATTVFSESTPVQMTEKSQLN